jgi:hypothetical protein
MLLRPPTWARTTSSHYHVEVVAAFKWRLDQRHAACGAHGVPFGPADHHRIADCTSFETLTVILIPRVSNHANAISTRLCAAIGSCAMHKARTALVVIEQRLRSDRC